MNEELELELDSEHDCWDHAEYYEFYEEGHRFHGYDCSKCGKFLQSG